MRTLEELLKDGIKDDDWTYCKSEYTPHAGCKVGMPEEFTPDGTTKNGVTTCYVVTAKFRDGSTITNPAFMYLDDGNFYWYDNLWYDTDKVEEEKEPIPFCTPIAWIAYRNIPECNITYPIAPHNESVVPTPPPKED